jgi:hypothetical protein
MSTAAINPDVLEQLQAAELAEGSHGSTFNGEACSMEWVALLAGEGMTDAPDCASPVLARYTIRLNDRWDRTQRQALKPYLPRMVGTGGDGKDGDRERIASEWLTGRLLGPWLDLAGMGDHLASIEGKSGHELRLALYEIRKVAWAKRDASRAELRAKIEARLLEQGKPSADAVAVADAVADAVAAAVAAAVAVADAAAVAVAVADAVAVAAAVADAAAAADADGPVDWWDKPYGAAYRAAAAYYREHPLPVMDAITELAAQQQPLALELLDALIDPVQS